MTRALFFLAAVFWIIPLTPLVGWSADDPKSPKPEAPRSTANPSAKATASTPTPTPALTAEVEAEAMTLVRQHLPELAQVLEPLKTRNASEYRKAIAELATEARTLNALRAKNPARFELALEAWKARTTVELIAAKLSGDPSPEQASQLRAAIENRIEVDIRRQRFEADQLEASVVKAREHLSRVEANRDRVRDGLQRAEASRSARAEARYRALLPKKVPPTATVPTPRSSFNTTQRPSPTLSHSALPIPSPTLSVNSRVMPSPTLPDNAVPMPSPDATIEGNLR